MDTDGPDERASPLAGEALGMVEAAYEPLRVLVVDADAEAPDTFAGALANVGHRVARASSASEGLAVVLEFDPQIVFIDGRLPSDGGLELCRNLRRTSFGRAMYVAMLVEPTELDRLEEAFEAGVDDFLVTPIDPQHLAWRLRSTRRLLDLQARTALERTKQQEQVAKLALLTRRLRVATMFDHVTNLPNQHYLEEQLASYWEDAVDSEAELALIYIDLDGIGQINESRGHRAGSSALRQAAQALQDTLDRGAFGVRYGGDEFVVALKGTLLEGATLAQRIIDAIAADPLFEGDPIRLTASAGVASGPAPFANADALLDAAYHALRRAKKDGGGRVRIRDPHGDAGRRAG